MIRNQYKVLSEKYISIQEGTFLNRLFGKKKVYLWGSIEDIMEENFPPGYKERLNDFKNWLIKNNHSVSYSNKKNTKQGFWQDYYEVIVDKHYLHWLFVNNVTANNSINADTNTVKEQAIKELTELYYKFLDDEKAQDVYKQGTQATGGDWDIGGLT